MQTQELGVSEYIYALIAIVVIALVQIGFSCYCCYAVFFKRALKCPCETLSKCLCKDNLDAEKNLPGTEDEISRVEEVPGDQVKEVTRTNRCRQILRKMKTKYNGPKKARVLKNVQKSQRAQNEVSIPIEEKHETIKTPAKSKKPENTTNSETTNRARTTNVPVVKKDTSMSVVVQVTRH